jgi:hypothetical protein
VPYYEVAAAARPSTALAVGVVLETGGWDRRRSLPRSLVDALARLSGVEVVSVQLSPKLAGVRDWSTPDVVQLASRLLALDVVITPDSMVAHLAGALGVKTWTLLQAEPDWRWHQPERSDSPWYPSMRLFRQPTEGNWQPVVNGVLAELSALVS